VEDRQIGMFTSDNTERVRQQKNAPIFVVIGNPPYNAGQVNENDNNKNRTYPAIDKRVADTYARDSRASNKNALSDPYVKAFRLAADRVLSKGEGVVCMVTNNGFLDGIAFDGMRKHLRRDFDRVSIVDLGGNVRKNPKLSGTTHNVFGIQVGACIALMEHHADRADGVVQYARMDEFWKRGEKYRELNRWGDVANVAFENIADNDKNLWLTEGMADDWDSLLPMGETASSRGEGPCIFSLISNGVKTNRDTWVYNFDSYVLERNVRRTVDFYLAQVGKYQFSQSKTSIDDFVENDETKISWSATMKDMLKRSQTEEYEQGRVRKSLYRPFTCESLYFSKLLNERRYQFPKIFPLTNTENRVIGVPGAGGRLPFWTLASDTIMNLSITSLDATQCFPLYIYDEDGTNRRDNITDWGLEQFTGHYNDGTITKLDVFLYVYGILHDPAYREKYAANLRRELPRIPFAPDFWSVANKGKTLMNLHVNYEDQSEYPLQEVWSIPKGYRTPYGEEARTINDVPLRDRYRVVKMKRNKKDPTQIIVNDFLTLTGLPSNVDEYRLGNRSAIDWIIDQYQISTDKRSGIVNDPNREDDLTYIIRLIKKVVTVSVETVGVVGGGGEDA